MSNNRLTENQRQFLDDMSIYINKPLHLYGSIHRADYIPGKSDIDIDVFTDNENSTIHLLCNFLNLKKYEVKKTVLKLNSLLVYGHKVQYEDTVKNINAEISIFNEKYKNVVMKEHNNARYLPFYLTIPLMIIKCLFYNLNLIHKNTYKRCKQYLMNNNDEMKFIELID